MTRFSIATGVSMIIYMSIYICKDLFPGADTRGMRAYSFFKLFDYLMELL